MKQERWEQLLIKSKERSVLKQTASVSTHQEHRLLLFRDLRYFTIFYGQAAELHSDVYYYLKRAQLPTSTHNGLSGPRTHRHSTHNSLAWLTPLPPHSSIVPEELGQGSGCRGSRQPVEVEKGFSSRHRALKKQLLRLCLPSRRISAPFHHLPGIAALVCAVLWYACQATPNPHHTQPDGPGTPINHECLLWTNNREGASFTPNLICPHTPDPRCVGIVASTSLLAFIALDGFQVWGHQSSMGVRRVCLCETIW